MGYNKSLKMTVRDRVTHKSTDKREKTPAINMNAGQEVSLEIPNAQGS